MRQGALSGATACMWRPVRRHIQGKAGARQGAWGGLAQASRHGASSMEWRQAGRGRVAAVACHGCRLQSMHRHAPGALQQPVGGPVGCPLRTCPATLPRTHLRRLGRQSRTPPVCPCCRCPAHRPSDLHQTCTQSWMPPLGHQGCQGPKRARREWRGQPAAGR